MTIEISLMISVLSILVSIVMAVFNISKSSKNENKQDAATLTTVIVKLDILSNNLAEIKSQIQDHKKESKELSERLIKVEQNIKVLNNSIFKNSKGEKNA